MNERRSLTVWPRTRPLLAALFLYLTPLLACRSPAPPAALLPAENFTAITTSVSQARGLPWKQPIILAAADSNRSFNPNADLYNGVPITELERAYKAIGILAGSDDFRASTAEFLRLEALFRYEHARGRATWSPSAAQLGAALPKLESAKARDLVPVLAAMEALQEQHFRWRAASARVTVEDRRAALAALAAGDAMMTLVTRDLEKTGPRLDLSESVAAALERLGADLPAFLRGRLSFPYRHGSRFVYWAFTARGWQGVNALYSDPPLSTAEILHPEKYFIERDRQLRFFPPQLLRRFKQPALIEQTIGEAAIAGLLIGARSPQAAQETAAAWRGDQLFHFVESGSATTVWLSSWQTEKHADEFFRAYWATLEIRHRSRFEMAGANAPAIARGRERTWLLQRSGELVLLASASPATDLHELAANTWQDLEIDKEPMELRFESAHARHQFSSASR